MPVPELYLAGVGAYFPSKTEVKVAVAQGKYSLASAERNALRSITCATDETGPSMAMMAGRRALDNAGLTGNEIDLLLHAVAVYNGLDGWNSASYLQNELLAGAGIAFELRQLSNGAVGALQLAASYLEADPKREHALITTADTFTAPDWDRWTADPGLVFADGASAVVLSTRPGQATLLGMHTHSDSTLEMMQRGRSAFVSSAGQSARPNNLARRYREFFDDADRLETGRRLANGVRVATAGALERAGLDLGQIDHVITPNFGMPLLERQCLDPLRINVSRTLWTEWGRYTGHAGAADQFGGLDYLIRSARGTAGQTVLILGIGAGFVWTSVVVRITDNRR